MESKNNDAQSSNPNIGLIDHNTTVVLVGRTGNGKSATGNSILGTKSFVSKTSSSGVTVTTQLQHTQFPDGPLLNVIDTPGLFDCSLEDDTNEDLQIARKKVDELESELIKNSVMEKEEILQAREASMKKSLEEQLKQATQMIELKAMETNMMLQQQLEEEKKARLKVEEEKKAYDNELKRKSDELRWRNEELARHNAERARNQCNIL